MKTQENQNLMADNETKNYTYSFKSSKSREKIFQFLLDIDKWWSGLFEETITGDSHKLKDEFSFKAGGGAHYSKQRLVEMVSNKKIVWQVTESNLSFLKDTNEWTDTKLRFDLLNEKTGTRVTFTHEGLVPEFECYEVCSGAWSQYLEKLKAKLS
jgi:hypothetical protein